MIGFEEKKMIKTFFEDWLEVQEARKSLSKDASELKKGAADILNVKVTKVTKLFGFMKKLYEDDNDELSDLMELMNEVKDING